MPKKSPQERFWDSVTKTHGCWLWTGRKNATGYGYLSIGSRETRKNVMAHRFSYELAKGSIPSGMGICHTCDTPACVNPDHLVPGDQAFNVKDMMDKGRGRTGSISREDMADLETRLMNGEPAYRLFKTFNVTYGRVKAIRKRLMRPGK